MSNVLLSRAALWALPFTLALVMTAGSVHGQEAASAPAAAKAEKEKKSAGRLPTYYAQVVTKEQREKIYGLQTKYAEQIQKLRDQLATTEMEQKSAIEAVLTPEQKQQVAKLTDEAKARRSKKPAVEAGGESTE